MSSPLLEAVLILNFGIARVSESPQGVLDALSPSNYPNSSIFYLKCGCAREAARHAATQTSMASIVSEKNEAK